MTTKAKTAKTPKAAKPISLKKAVADIKKVAADTKAAAAKTPAKKKSKRDICRELLTRKQGATSKELCKATGWKAISVPPLAKALGLKLKSKPHEDGGLTYFA